MYFKKMRSVLFAIVAIAILMGSVFPIGNATNRPPATNGYRDATERALSSNSTYPFYDGCGYLFDIDNNGIDELVLQYFVDGYKFVYSIYTKVQNEVVTLVDESVIYLDAAGSFGSVSILEKNDKRYIAENRELSETGPGATKSEGSWTLYTIEGMDVVEDTYVEYEACTVGADIDYSQSFAIMDNQKVGYDVMEAWLDSFSDPVPSDAYMTLEELLQYFDENGEGADFVESAVTRIFGSNRYETAFKVADALLETWGTSQFGNIIVASGNEFPDALAGSYLATVKGAPILLVNPRMCGAVKDYITANLIPGGTVYLLGGVNAVPAEMETGLDGFNVVRLAGANRYETNLAILNEAGATDEPILVCTGTGFADSLSASAVGAPILLVNPRGLTQPQKDYLAAASRNFIIIGGESAVPPAIAEALAAYGTVDRLAGDNRYETSVMVAQMRFREPASAVLAYAQNFPDGLCGGPLAYAMNAPLLLTATNRGPIVAEYAQANAITSGIVLGGETLIDDATARNVFSLSSDALIVAP